MGVNIPGEEIVDHATVIVAAENADAARAWFRSIDPDAGSTGGFAVPLSADGLSPATHYGIHTPLTQEMLESVAQSSGLHRVYYGSNGWGFATALADAGLTIVEDEP